MKKLFLLLLTVLTVSISAYAQKKVSGTVIEAGTGEPLIGATVMPVGGGNGVATDIDGKFTMTVPNNVTKIKVSFVGMQTQTVAITDNMKIALSQDNKLEEVVVTGYGSTRKLGSVVGSVTAVSGEIVENSPVANIGDALQGQVAGLQVFTSSGEPSSSVSMRIRGVSSINSSSTPLFILDGSPISSGAFTALNPNDIESMTVLKDASATAIYGSRAANGVVILTTKKGKRGQKANVVVSAQFGVSKMTGDKMDMMNAEQWLNFQEILDPSMKNNEAFQAEKKFYIDNGISTDWADIFFGGTAPTQQYDLSITGGTEDLNYYLSFSHYDADGIMDDSNLRRETLRSNIDANVNKWIRVGANLSLSYQKYTTAAFGNTANSVYNKAYASRIYRPDQSYYEILRNEDGSFAGFGDRLDYFDKLGFYNPYYLSEIQPAHNDMVRINGGTFVNINPIKGLNIRAAQGVEAYDYRYSYVAMPVEPFTGNGSAREDFQRYYQFTYTNTAEYRFNLENIHNFSVLAGQESIITKNQSFNSSVDGLTDPRLTLMSAGSIPTLPSHSIYDKVFNSFFGTFSYNYDEKYFVDLTYRRDGSSLFAKNKQWGDFWSAGAMWNIKKENFLNDITWLNALSLKASYGVIGNSSGLDPYMSLGLIGSGPLYNGVSGTAVANPSNPDLTWEVVKSTNIGVSARVLDRVNFDVEYYNKKTEDMLMEIPYSFTTGFSAGWGNVASMRNRGFDATVNVDILKNVHGIDWSVSANVNYNKNEITELFNGQDEYVIANTGLKLQVGKPYGEFFYTRWVGVDPNDGYNVWLDKNGNKTKVFSEDDAVFTGKQRYAPWSGGFGTRASWKGITISADFSFMVGQHLINNERWFTENPQFASSNNQTTKMFTMWQKKGDITDISTPESPMQFDTHLIEDASFLRMKNVTVSYNLPQNIIRKTGFIEGCKVFFIGRNLLTITDYQGYDPEVDSNMQLGNYPNTKQYTFGVELKF
ncbi:MAG: TonB-dependent receptor [Muribaculaceae bacterium]|nr:TonB-dependent receptor [Muribaculaceae bacterium]